MFEGVKSNFQGSLKFLPKNSKSQDSNLVKNSSLESVRFPNRDFSTLKKTFFRDFDRLFFYRKASFTMIVKKNCCSPFGFTVILVRQGSKTI